MVKLLEIKTVQTGAFRILIEAMKEILSEANFEFSPSGIKLKKMNHSNTILVHLKLDSENFDEYFCKKKINLGISLINFFKYIKSMGNNDTLTLSMDEEDTSELSIIMENTNKKIVRDYKLKLLDLNETDLKIKPVSFPSVITMPSQDFQKICRDMCVFSDEIQITTVSDELRFYGAGDTGRGGATIKESQNGVNFLNKENNAVIQGNYSLSSLILFTKCTNLCNSIQLYLKNDFFLMVKYSCANLGEIKFCLSQINK